MQKILGFLRKAVTDYEMIKDGDKIVVGLSGGKDSILLVSALKAYQRFSPEKFELFAVTVDMGFNDVNTDEVEAMRKYLDGIGVPWTTVKTDIGQIVFEERKETNPCSLCSKMRRGALNSAVKELGANKLALAHNADDVVETMLMSLIFEGRFSTFSPTAYMDKSGVSLIRPMIYIQECEIKSAVSRLNLPIVHNPCPPNRHTRREWAKDTIKNLCKEVPFAKERMLGAIFHPERNNLWEKPKK